MNRITLQEYLETHKHLHIGMKVSSELLDNMVVRGFVNSSKDMIDDSKINMTKKDSLLGIVDNDCSIQVICENYIYQVISWYDGEKVQQQGLVNPIYAGLYKFDFDANINIENLYIPDLISHPLYRIIHARKGVTINEQLVNKYRPNKDKTDRWKSHNIFVKDGKAYMPIKKGDWVLRPLYDMINPFVMEKSIKSVAQEILVVCTYIHGETGRRCYALFGLEELIMETEQG